MCHQYCSRFTILVATLDHNELKHQWDWVNFHHVICMHVFTWTTTDTVALVAQISLDEGSVWLWTHITGTCNSFTPNQVWVMDLLPCIRINSLHVWSIFGLIFCFLTLNSTVTETYTTAFPGLLGPGCCNLLPIWNCMHFFSVKLI